MIPDSTAASVLQTGLVPDGTRVQVFSEIYWVFLALGTLVGAVVIGYMLYNGYKYSYEGGADEEDRPKLGEIPTGGGKGKKLFLSLSLSAIIVISLIAWTYGTLLFVEGQTGEQGVDVEVEGYQFGWNFHYLENDGDYSGGVTSDDYTGVNTTNTLRVPVDTQVNLYVTSDDVFHNFGIPELRVKSDAIPGSTTDTWFEATEVNNYTAHCYELCGQGHSYMDAEVVVMPQDEYQDWYDSQIAAANNESASNASASNASASNESASNASANNESAASVAAAGV
ncbi:cytochrome c oxidase subunit II [Halolamina sp. CBA1230]|uniref:cytochrome c oxidase subunit II n=1 Tax=Halolamina sp. CBA1230 TaxID=1853690 RepID=UPI0009A23AF4|nr:cytochrome c oxidase subunit II [Halolamina sp. CBA1230]QKY19959.1 cytochrome c oxidase subunit II [Halolamina sp. CBA1230]